ncbi:unnamed protein product [Urochloa decumbens]|uniref:F-box domain-containing protein n=1 Tax=Urochloa decumbens TaxID=240449 RepID=A0ABC9CMF0_9POAL
MEAPNPRHRPDSHGGALPLPADALYEVLLRVPARDLCRLRAVCRLWRRLLSDPHFVAVHTGHHPEPQPLIVIGYGTYIRDGGFICDVVDLTGRVVKRVRAPGDGVGAEAVRFIHLDFVCTSKGTYRCLRFLNLATGSAYALPEGLAEEHAAYQPYTNSWVEAAFGQLCEVFTLDGGNHARWRGKKSPPIPVIFGCGRSVAVIVNGIAYFFAQFVQPQDFARDCIASFDLETEEWKPSLRGPLSSLADAPGSPDPDLGDLSMAAMNGCLVVVHNSNNIIDLWFLMDIERGLWVKKHSIPI